MHFGGILRMNRFSWGWLLGGAIAIRAETPAWEEARAHARAFQLAPDLHLEVWATEPQLSNGVAFSFDGQGRCYVAETHRYGRSIFDITQKTNWLVNDLAFRSVADRTAFLENQFNALQPDRLTRESEVVRVLEDRDGAGRATHSEQFADGFDTPADGTAAGVLATPEAIWFGNIPNLWRFPSPGISAQSAVRPRESVAFGFGVHIGVTGHDLHGLIRGPDGRIYFSFGDRGVDPSTLKGLAPVLAHVALTLRDTGGVMRCEPDGSNLELFCYGLRNPQELAFDDLGNLWTVDNDTAGPDDCRVLHLVEGGDYGWRCSYQHMAGFGPWVQENLWRGGQDGILPLAGTVSQGPSGLAFYPGTGFGDRLAGRFLHCDFPAGIWSFSVSPRGGSYSVAAREKFLWNCWATDVDFGPDGAAYVLDWVSGWEMPDKGRIYRLTDPAHSKDPVVAEVKRLLAGGFGERSAAELIGWLGHPDRRIRLGAQWELAARGDTMFPSLLELARSNSTGLSRRHALWALGQGLRRKASGSHASDLVSMEGLLGDSDPEIRGQVAELLGERHCWGSAERIFRGLEDPDARVRMRCAAAGVKLVSPVPVEGAAGESGRKLWPERAPSFPEVPIFRLAANSTDPFWDHFAAQMLAQRWGADGGEAWRHAAKNPATAVRRLALLAARRLGLTEVAEFLRDSELSLVEAAGRAIHDVPIAAEFPRLAQTLLRVDCPPGLQSRAIDACLRLGSAQHATLLGNFAARRDVPSSSRAFAIQALADWGAPGPIDRINGLWRPLVTTGRSSSTGVVDDSADSAGGVGAILKRAAVTVPGPVSRFDGAAELPSDLGRLASFDEGMAVKRREAPARKAFLAKASEFVASGDPEIQRAVLYAAVQLRTKEASTPLFELLASPTTAPSVRSQILPALVALNAAQVGEAVRLALADADPSVQASAIPHLGRLEGEQALVVLRDFVRGATNSAGCEAAQVAYAALAQLGSPAADDLILSGLEELLAGRLSPALGLDVEMAAIARSPVNPRLRERLEALTARSRPDDPLARYRAALIGGLPARGRALFLDNSNLQCLRCHIVSRNGGTVGPALDGIGSRQTPEYLLASIVFPNQAYAPGYTPATGALSAMPEGLADTLTLFQLRDLVAFLGSLRQ